MRIDSTRTFSADANGLALPRTPPPHLRAQLAADEDAVARAYLGATGADLPELERTIVEQADTIVLPDEVAALLPTGLADVVDAIGEAWVAATTSGFAA